MKTIPVFFLLPFISFSTSAQIEWQLKKEKDGIKIYTAKTEGTRFKAVKTEFNLAASGTEFMDIILAVNKYPDWVYRMKESKVLKQIAAGELIYYAEISTPWPFSNRDIVAHVKISHATSKIWIIESSAEPEFIPEKEGIERVMKSQSRWVITELNDHLVSAVYTFQFDPGGNVPAWLANMFLTDGPTETFTNLKERIK